MCQIQTQMQDEVVCPNCHSSQITATAKGFNSTVAGLNSLMGGSAVSSMSLGMVGSGKIVITCLKCGNQFKAGDGSLKTIDADGKEMVEKQVYDDSGEFIRKTLAITLGIIALIAIAIFYNTYLSPYSYDNNHTSIPTVQDTTVTKPVIKKHRRKHKDAINNLTVEQPAKTEDNPNGN